MQNHACIINSEDFRNSNCNIPIILGKDFLNENIITDLTELSHLLIAGTTGSGKSVFLSTIILSILYKFKPNEIKLILMDTRLVNFSRFNSIPHLLIPVIADPKKAVGVLSWTEQEIIKRYKLFAEKDVKDIKGYNDIIEAQNGKKLPYIVVILEDLSDLMIVTSDTDDILCRLTQMSGTAGIHLIISTQRPSTDVITGAIKANIPSRIAFVVPAQVDSRTIIYATGAEKLSDNGDTFFLKTGELEPIRLQTPYVSDEEINSVLKSLS